MTTSSAHRLRNAGMAAGVMIAVVEIRHRAHAAAEAGASDHEPFGFAGLRSAGGVCAADNADAQFDDADRACRDLSDVEADASLWSLLLTGKRA